LYKAEHYVIGNPPGDWRIVKDRQIFLIMGKMSIFWNRYIQGVSGGIVNILGGGSMDYSE